MRSKSLAHVVLAASLAARSLGADQAVLEALATSTQNLLTNGSFDGSTAGWSTWDAAIPTACSTQATPQARARSS